MTQVTGQCLCGDIKYAVTRELRASYSAIVINVEKRVDIMLLQHLARSLRFKSKATLLGFTPRIKHGAAFARGAGATSSGISETVQGYRSLQGR